MKKLALGITLGFTMIGSAMAQGGPGCGLGSMLFEGKSGVAPQVLAATTNGTFGNQTFGISSGTLGCSQNDTVRSRAKLGLFMGSNMEKLARDMSAGEGESLAAVADILGVKSDDRAAFYSTLRDQFAKVFTGTDVTAEVAIDNMKNVLAADSRLAQYASRV